MPLSKGKTDMVAGVFAAAPDDVLHRLEGLLAGAKLADPTLEPVHLIAATEASRRRVIATAFGPILPLATKGQPPKRPLLIKKQIAAAWREVADTDPDLAERTESAAHSLWEVDEPPPVFDLACRRAAEFADDPVLAKALRLAPQLRTIQPKLSGWLRNLSGENIAAIRLAFKDALTLDEDCGPLFWNAIMAMLGQPWQILRLISAANDRPSDRYLASSELADIGERILADIDERIGTFKLFDPNRGEETGAAEAASIFIVVQEIAEFEEWLTLRRDGPWGARIVEQKSALALTVENKLRETEPAVASALPTQPPRPGMKGVRPAPRLDADPRALHVTRAKAMLTLLEEIRPAAAAGGFASLRAKVLESLEMRLDQYCADLVEILHKRDSDDLERVRAYLEIAADFTALVKGPQAAQIVRRRVAAA